MCCVISNILCDDCINVATTLWIKQLNKDSEDKTVYDQYERDNFKYLEEVLKENGLQHLIDLELISSSRLVILFVTVTSIQKHLQCSKNIVDNFHKWSRLHCSLFSPTIINFKYISYLRQILQNESHYEPHIFELFWTHHIAQCSLTSHDIYIQIKHLATQSKPHIFNHWISIIQEHGFNVDINMMCKQHMMETMLIILEEISTSPQYRDLYVTEFEEEINKFEMCLNIQDKQEIISMLETKLVN